MLKSLVISFLPWILYSILVGPTQQSLDIAICVAAFTSVACELRGLKKGYVLCWGTLIFFVFLFIAVVIYRNAFIAKYEWVLSNGMLALITWVSIIIRRPFTMQYAREEVLPEFWHTPLFIKINYMLSAIWGILFSINLALNLLHIYLPFFTGWMYQVSTYLPTILGVWITNWFPAWYKNRAIEKIRLNKLKSK